MKIRLIKVPLIAATALLMVSPAAAQKRPDSGKDALETKESKAKDVLRPDQGADDFRPEDTEVEKFVAGKEQRLSKVRNKQIADMRKILKKNPLYKRKADLLFRIAEKEREEAKYNYFLARKKYDKQLDAHFNGTLKQKPEEPVPDYSKALVEYKKLLKEFPNYKRIDEVMFYLGRGLIAAEKKKEGASYMLRLTKEHPKSKFVSRAYLAVGEYYFDNDLLFAAKTNYLEVLKDTKSSEYPYALYKLGYVYYNLREYEDSIKSFHRVVELSKSGDKRGVYFKNQSFSAVTLAYAEVPDGWKRARDYFRKAADEKIANERLESIARIYNKQDKTDQEVEVYEYLISANKEGPKVPEYAEKLTAAARKAENLDKTEKVINRFVTYFDPKGSWHAVNKEKEEPMTRATQYREEMTDYLIGQYHTKAQELEKLKQMDKANAYYGSAAKYYERYLAWFPESKDLYEKQFFLAEIYYFQMRKWDDAAKHYTGVVKQDPKGKYSKESAYAVILCKEEKMADDGLIPRPKRAGDKKGRKKDKAKGAKVVYDKRDKDDKFEPLPEKPLVASEKEFLEACVTYTDLFPKDDEVPAVAFRSAEIFIKKGHYPEGISRLEIIMEHHPKHEFAGFAAATLFDSNYRLRRWDQMERWGRYMLDTRNFKVLKKKQLLDVIAISINEYATELKGKGEKAKAVEQWLRFVKEFPKHDKAGIALFNAAATTEGLEKTEQAIDLYESLIKRYPKMPQATEAHFVLGALYESQTDFETAATYFEKMAAFPDHEKQADSLYNAGAIRTALEQNEKAVGIYRTYVGKFPARADTAEIQLQIAELELKQGNFQTAQREYDTYIKKYGKAKPGSVVNVHLRKAKAFQKEAGKNARKLASAQLGLALKAYKRMPDEAKSNDSVAGKTVRRDAAEARFLEGEYVYADFEKVKVSFPDRVLRKTLVKKAELLEKSGKIYFDVLEYKAHDVSAGALFRIGESYYLFAKSLFDLPIPEELNEDEQFVYRAELDDKAAPLQEKAIEAMGQALKLAHVNKVYNEWSRRSAALLVKLSPEAFPVLDDATNNTEWQVPSTFSTTYIKKADGKLESMLKREAEEKARKEAEAKAKAEAEAKAKAEAEAKAAAAAKDGKAAPAGDKKATDAEKPTDKKKGGK